MIVLALVNKMLAQVKEDPASVLALYNDVRRNITTNINTAMMVYLAQQASGMHFSGDIVNVPGTSVMGAQSTQSIRSIPMRCWRWSWIFSTSRWMVD